VSLPVRLWRPRRRPAVKPAPRPDTHVTREQSPLQIGISPQMPGSMPRAEDDRATLERSPAFHDRPGSGNDTSTRHFYF
jgi:hypothetical protein